MTGICPFRLVRLHRKINISKKKHRISFGPVVNKNSLLGKKVIDEIARHVKIIKDRALYFFFPQELRRRAVRFFQTNPNPPSIATDKIGGIDHDQHKDNPNEATETLRMDGDKLVLSSSPRRFFKLTAARGKAK